MRFMSLQRFDVVYLPALVNQIPGVIQLRSKPICRTRQRIVQLPTCVSACTSLAAASIIPVSPDALDG